jgi:ribosomal protein S18 acetylase RimI-like enzyme
MRETGQLEIRLLDESDIQAAMLLKESARWNQTEGDWRRLLRLEPRGCFCAKAGGVLAGTTTTITYGSELAWIGMVLVDPEYRRRRIATRLMQAALDYLSERVATVKLDATPDGRPVYENLGFEVESLVERWAGRARAVPTASCAMLETAAQGELFALDQHAFGADRSELIGALLADACAAPVVATTADGRLSGYAVARRGSNAAYVGPLVAADAKQAARLLDCLLNQLASQPVYVDVNTNFETGVEILAARGFIKQRELLRMSYGAQHRAAASETVFAIAGPEVG